MNCAKLLILDAPNVVGRLVAQGVVARCAVTRRSYSRMSGRVGEVLSGRYKIFSSHTKLSSIQHNITFFNNLFVTADKG